MNCNNKRRDFYLDEFRKNKCRCNTFNDNIM